MNDMELKDYKGTETFQLLVRGVEAPGIVEDWAERNLACDLRLRRAKTRGSVVIEVNDPVFAANVKNWHPDCQVHIKEL